MCKDNDDLYVLLREPFFMNSGLERYTICSDGSLLKKSGTQNVHGTIAAHIYAESGTVWCANYINGIVIRMPNIMTSFEGCGSDPVRQASSHPHCITPTVDGKYLCICDLGTDKIFVTTKYLDWVSEVSLPDGSGPRHMIFSSDGKYAFCCTELQNTVCVLEYQNGTLRYLYSVSTLPDDYQGTSYCGGIRLSDDNKKLFVSNRGHNSISVFSVNGDSISLEGHIPSGGEGPRDFCLYQRYLITGNDLSNNICVFDLSSELPQEPVFTYPTPRPWCILPVEI